jgi:hypothetical protein
MDSLFFSSWVKFEDDRILSVDGLHLKNMLKNREEMSEDMFRAVVRVLRIDEAERKIVPNGNCHYVMHDWAVRLCTVKLVQQFLPCYIS